jgi:TonB family protein
MRLYLVCIAVSIGLHSLLLLSGNRGARISGHAGDGSDLNVALVSTPAFEDVAVPSDSALAPTPLPSISTPVRRRPKLLPFSPMDLPPSQFDESAYQPLSKLTTPPTAAQEIMISYPQGPDRVGVLVAALTLFIDEDGSVAKVRVDEPRAPAAYEEAAVDAFSKARFKPGMAGAQPVKTRMVIRVAFESGSTGPNSSAGIRFK